MHSPITKLILKRSNLFYIFFLSKAIFDNEYFSLLLGTFLLSPICGEGAYVAYAMYKLITFKKKKHTFVSLQRDNGLARNWNTF